MSVIVFTIWCVNLLLVPQIKMQKSGVGERTKFIVDITDKGYDYYLLLSGKKVVKVRVLNEKSNNIQIKRLELIVRNIIVA